MFTSKELATIMVGLNFVKSQVDKRLIDDAKGVELKIKEVIPDDLRDFMESIEERTVVDPYMNFGADKMEGGDWYIISNAISQNQAIKFNYRSRSGEETTSRKIDPYLIVFYRDHWNVIGHSHKREAVRNFVLDRMSDIQLLDEDFVPYGKIDVKALIFRSDGKSHKIEVNVHKSIEKRFKANLPANILKKKEINPNFIRCGFTFDNLDFINEWLLQFANDIKIVKPDLLIEKRNRLLQSMIDN